MYKRVSTALNHPRALITLRLSTLALLGTLAWFKYVDIQSFAYQVDFEFFLQVVLVGFLTMMNLATEALKYQSLYGKAEMDVNLAFKSILSGMSVGIWTPNRAGEFIGRLKWSPKGKRSNAIGATLLGSFLQGVITLFMGVIGILFFDFPVQVDLPTSSFIVIGALIFAALTVIVRTGPLRKFREKHIKFSLDKILRASIFAASRYLIFTSQFVLLLYAFGFEGDFIHAYLGVFVLYIIQTYMPGSMLSELGIREVLAIFLFAPFFENEIGAALAAFCLWLLNIGIPIAAWSIYGTFNRLEFR